MAEVTRKQALLIAQIRAELEHLEEAIRSDNDETVSACVRSVAYYASHLGGVTTSF